MQDNTTCTAEFKKHSASQSACPLMAGRNPPAQIQASQCMPYSLSVYYYHLQAASATAAAAAVAAPMYVPCIPSKFKRARALRLLLRLLQLRLPRLCIRVHIHCRDGQPPSLVTDDVQRRIGQPWRQSARRGQLGDAQQGACTAWRGGQMHETGR